MTHYSIHKGYLLFSILSQTIPVHFTPADLYKIRLNVIQSTTFWSSYSSLSFLCSASNLYALLFPHSRYMLRPPHRSRLYHSKYIWRRVQTRRSSLCSLLHPSVTSSIFDPNILLSAMFSNTFSLCSSLNIRDQISHPCRTTFKIILLYSNCF
jgi:hypothetical protein